MNVAIVYVYPITGEPHHDHYAMRFLQSYHSNPTEVQHTSIVVCNGGGPNTAIACMFSTLSNLTLLHHDDSGWDIGAYQFAARNFKCDLMVFFGGSTYIKGPKWLERVVNSFQKRGRALYGTMGNQGNIPIGVYPHIRTTAFWMDPETFSQHPIRVTSREGRYPFEHGPDSLTQWVGRIGLKAYVVTWHGEYEQAQWNDDPNGFHHGNQSAMLFGDRLTEPPFYHTP